MLAALHVHPVTCSLGVPTRHLDMQFIAHAPADAEIACSDESLDLRWWPLDALPHDATSGSRSWRTVAPTDFGAPTASHTALSARLRAEIAQTSVE